jgi:hypothetical protein
MKLTRNISSANLATLFRSNFAGKTKSAPSVINHYQVSKLNFVNPNEVDDVNLIKVDEVTVFRKARPHKQLL